MEAEVVGKQRCLLCRSEIPGEVKTEEGSNSSSVLSKHLRVIFLLRKVLQVPMSLLARFLASCPNVDGWVSVCERCQGLVRECRQVHRQIVELKRRWAECRLLVVKIVKETADSAGTENDDVGLLDIDKEVRTFVVNHEFSTWQNPFIKGDLMAERKKASLVDHETFEDFGAFQDNNDAFEENTDLDDNLMDYNEEAVNEDPLDIPVDIPVSAIRSVVRTDKTLEAEEEEENEEEMVKDDKEKDEDWRKGATLNKKRKIRKKKKPKKGVVPKPKPEPKRPPFQFVDLLPKRAILRQGPSERPKLTLCSKAELIETVHYQKKSVEEFLSIIESRQETLFNFTTDQKRYIQKSITRRISSYRAELRKHKRKKSKIPSYQGDFEVTFPSEKEPSPPPPPPVEAAQSKIVVPVRRPEDDFYQTKCYVSGCLQVCPTLEELQAHQNRDHTEEERKSIPETAKIYQCTKCLKTFQTKYYIIKHLRRTCNPQKKVNSTGIRFQCLVKDCSKIWLSVKTLSRHQETEHLAEEVEAIPKNAPIHQCFHCKLMFNTLERLRLHLRKVHGEGPPLAICDVCGKTGKSSAKIERHQKTSLTCRRLQGLPEPEKTWVCDHCGIGFRDQPQLKYHIQSVHEQYSEQCDICGKSFSKTSYLTKHRARVHKIGDFPCTEDGCGKVYWKQSALNWHVAYVHRGTGGHFCKVKDCGRRFREKKFLENHMNQDHLKGEPEYKCEECGKLFYFSMYLAQHKALVHRGQKKKRRTERRGQVGAVRMTEPTYAMPHASTEEVWKSEEHEQPDLFMKIM